MECTKFKIPAEYDDRNINKIKVQLEGIVNEGNFHFLFLGPVGCGKSYLAQIIYKYWLKSKDQNKCTYLDSRDVYSDYLFHISFNSPDKANLLFEDRSVLRRFNFVVFDDIGTETPSTQAAHDFIRYLIEDRYKYAKTNTHSATILVTNLPLDSQNDTDSLRNLYGDRVVNRLFEMCVIVKFGCHSFRMDNKRILKNEQEREREARKTGRG